MSETEKQEGQKTVVAFIAGLLIGGLLVWVFSSTPEQKPVEKAVETEKADETKKTDDTAKSAPVEEKKDVVATQTTEPKVSTIKAGDAVLKADDQAAGKVVTLTESKYPTNAGWVVVRDYMDGVPGRVLGAARFNTDEGLAPTVVNVLRDTEAGNSYQVVFYSDNGDKVFDLDDDLVIEGVSASFKAN